MIEEQVVITSIDPSGAWVEGMQQSACGSCSAKAGCGQHAMTQLGRKVTLWLPLEHLSDTVGFNVGQQVVVGLPEGAILRSTVVLYGVPLLALVLGAIIGHAAWGEVGSILISVVSMLIGFKLAQYWSLKNKQHWQPHFIRHCVPPLHNENKDSIIKILK
ncbi:MAG: sigma-E factor negative regulatory protein RseC [Oleispira sp.]|jgi:sigma-E factor negative regulatory protein RseC